MADINIDRILARIDTHEDARNKKEVNELKKIVETLECLNSTLVDINNNLGLIAHSLNAGASEKTDASNTYQLSITEAFGDFFKNLEERHD